MIKTENLSLKAGNMILFENLNIRVPKNKITVLVGANGVGKTTLLKVIAGIQKTVSGSVKTDSEKLFYLPQRIKYPSGITLREYIESSFFKRTWKWTLSKEEKNKVSEVLSLLELENKEETLTDNLSSGELQKANIALGLVSGADILLLDEPTSNMDLVNQIKILDIIKKLTEKGITCLIVLHDINLSASFGDYFIGLSKSGKIFAEEKNNFFTEEILNEIFGIKFRIINSDEYFHVQIFN